jgi:hypothetical protein
MLWRGVLVEVVMMDNGTTLIACLIPGFVLLLPLDFTVCVAPFSKLLFEFNSFKGQFNTGGWVELNLQHMLCLGATSVGVMII